MTGLSPSTLRYYESIGLINPIPRDDSSGHRFYSESDVDAVLAVACMAATGMPIDAMRQYIANTHHGGLRADDQIDLLREHDVRLAEQQRRLVLTRDYVAVKVAFWEAVRDGNERARGEFAAKADALAEELRVS